MASDATIKLEADAARYMAEVAKVHQANKRLAQSTGQSIEGGFTSAFVKLSVLQKAISESGRMLDAFVDKAERASKSAGSRALTIATALGTLGVKDMGRMTSTIENTDGSTTIDERVGFVERLADASKKARVPFKEDSVREAAEAYARGGDLLYGRGGEELVSGLGKGMSVNDIREDSIKGRQGLRALISDPNSPLAKEIDLRGRERNSQLFVERSRATSGFQARAGAVVVDEMAASRQGGLVDYLQDLPGTGSAMKLYQGRGQGVQLAGSDRLGNQLTSDAAVDAIEKQSELIRRQGNAQLNITARDP